MAIISKEQKAPLGATDLQSFSIFLLLFKALVTWGVEAAVLRKKLQAQKLELDLKSFFNIQ
jgi:hypothetical protein